MTIADEPSTAQAPLVGSRSPRVVRVIVLAAVIVIAMLTGAVVGRVTGQSTPDDKSVDAGFARDMSTHHAQAVEMSGLVADRTTGPEIKVLAADIALTQQEQIGRMKGWLVRWKLSPTASEPAMAWMANGGHDGHGGPQMRLLPDGRMPGMASQADLEKLRGLRGQSAEVLFLQLMVAHHRGGIAMAQHTATNADQPDVRELARKIAAGQSAEILTLQDNLRARGAAHA